MEARRCDVRLDPGDRTWVTIEYSVGWEQSRSGWIGEAENLMPLPEFRILYLSSASLAIIPARTLLKIVTTLRFSVKGEKHFMVAERQSASYGGFFSAM